MSDTHFPEAGLTLAIDLGALASNWRRMAELSRPAECAAVVKADAYGIGIADAVPALRRAGCRTFFVALPEEGERVRDAAPDASVYVLAGLLGDAGAYRAKALRPVLNHEDDLARWMESGGGHAALHVDTGMNRLGLPPAALEGLAARGDIARAGIRLLMSHLACADEPAHPKNVEQLQRFRTLRQRLPDIPASFANSAGILLGAACHFDLTRPGIMLYGADSAPGSALEPVITAEARILQVRSAASGETVGYGATEELTRPSRLAVLSAGYADGYPRAAGIAAPGCRSHVLIAGRAAPHVGRVSMDLMVVDVTDIPESLLAGATHAELFGRNLAIDAVAATRGTIAYELLTGLSRRAQRVYLNMTESV